MFETKPLFHFIRGYYPRVIFIKKKKRKVRKRVYNEQMNSNANYLYKT